MPTSKASVTLYAWAVPAWFRGAPVDHTWVTTFDNTKNNYPTINDVKKAGQDYWYCWGSYHPAGGTPGNANGALGKRAGNLSQAKCLVFPNADSNHVAAARGTIFVYGFDGVCHQLANQVLYSTGGSGRAPLTVSRARGYPVSHFLYGTYGLQHAAWAAKVTTCVGAAAPPNNIRGGVPRMTNVPDEFEEHVRSVLGPEDNELISKLMAFRSETQAYLAHPMPAGILPPSAEMLNARNQHFINQAAEILGPEKFEKVFGVKAGELVDLVDPNVLGEGKK